MDALVEAAIAHWAPRIVANGVPFTDFQEVTAGLQIWDDWCAAWSARGAVHEAIGRDDLAAGHGLSAGQHLTDAAVCYHFGKYLFVHDRPAMKAAHMKAVECRTLALPHLRPPGERVEIAYEGGALFGNLRRPRGVDRPPVVVMAMGLDSAKEEMHAYETSFLDRGMATLAFDGPGQGEGEYDFVIRHDYEVPVGAVLDFVAARGDVDEGRLAIWGVSLGGYYAARAAAFEPRIKAAVILSGPFDWGAIWDQLPAITRTAFQVRAGCESETAAVARAGDLSLVGVAEKINCPLFVVGGKRDGVIPYQDVERLAAEASGPVRVLII
ncbi:MAG: alpha/beta hydrolase, partial [Alphaproteobacteria bacterium]|nr:alpha/beta hydrolase [Alphaproteobacteria bacterium]